MATEGKTRPRDNNDYMTRHKQWLSGLNKQRQMKTLEDDAAIQNAIDKTKRFREYAAKLRANIRKEKEEPSEYLTESAVGNHSKEPSEPSNSKKSKKVLNSPFRLDKKAKCFLNDDAQVATST